VTPAPASEGMRFDFRGIRYDFSSRTHVMGILNITPDSFSDGGMYMNAEKAIERGIEMEDEGADMIDIGGVSTRPGSEPVPVEEELRRVLSVVKGLYGRVRIPISVDTFRAQVAARAIEAGADIINDVTGLTFDRKMAATIAAGNATAVIMHMKGTPKTMQDDPTYLDLIGEIRAYLRRQTDYASQSGIKQIFVDPGIGFGKTADHNLELIRRMGEVASLGCPVLVGPSRKSFIGKLLDLPPDQRVEGTAAAAVLAARNGAAVVRVHDVKEIVRALKVADAISRV